jgi:succinate-semialdehyde dehydrogenase / glutarate-semialdehyde dehydrogenase
LRSQVCTPATQIYSNICPDSLLDPATGKLIGTMPDMDKNDTAAAIEAAAAALPSFRKTTGRERARLLRKWYQAIMDNAEDLAKIITWENGKPLADATGEVTYGANFIEWFAEEAPRVYGDTIPASIAGNRVFTMKEPVGVCGLITPLVLSSVPKICWLSTDRS